MTPPAKQYGHHSQTYFNIGPYGKFIRKSSHPELVAQLELNLGELSLGGYLSELYMMTWSIRLLLTVNVI